MQPLSVRPSPEAICALLLPPTGHSLGGAVAQLCAVRLLQQLPPAAHENVSCIGFATPPTANAALAELARAAGWDRRLRNYMLPGAGISCRASL